MTAEQHLRAAEFTARHWHQAALGSGHIPFVHAIACISAAIAGETDPNQLGLDPSVHDAFRAALGEPDGATSHREPETDANGWTLKDDGIWTLPVDGGTVLMTRQTTPEERARFAEQWARDTKTKPNGADVDEPLPAPCASCIAGAHDPNYHRRRLNLPPPRIVPAEHCGHLPPQASFTTPPTECVLRPGHQGSHADDRGCRWWPTPEATRDGLREPIANALEEADYRSHLDGSSLADVVLATLEQHLDIGDAEAWCKACRRVWEGKAHRCEGTAEILLGRVRDVANTWFLEGEPGPTRSAGKHLLRVLDTPVTTRDAEEAK